MGLEDHVLTQATKAVHYRGGNFNFNTLFLRELKIGLD